MKKKEEYEIRSLRGLSFDELYASHLKAFRDYPFQWSKNALLQTVCRRGFDASLSFGAFYGKELVSFTLNGLGLFNNVKTVYDTGTGTVEGYRGHGLASKIFEFSLPYLKAAGYRQYVLEVLEENVKAFNIYSKQGFKVSRKFDCFRSETDKWNFSLTPLTDIELKEIDFTYQYQMELMPDFDLSWQNNFQALLKKPDDFRIVGAFKENKFVAYGIIDPLSGDIPQLAVSKPERRQGIGSMILDKLKSLNQADIIKVLNIESDKDGTKAFILKSGIPKIVSQFEMIKLI